LKIAITEANVNYLNAAADSVTGVGATSFLGGQWWAEFMGITMKHGVDFVNFWSTVEGRGISEEKGYISNFDGTKRPSYYHFQMMAQNFRGNVATATITDTQLNAKSFAAKDVDQVAVMILNQDQLNSFDYGCVPILVDFGAA
jgi:hypothetical protein